MKGVEVLKIQRGKIVDGTFTPDELRHRDEFSVDLSKWVISAGVDGTVMVHPYEVIARPDLATNGHDVLIYQSSDINFDRFQGGAPVNQFNREWVFLGRDFAIRFEHALIEISEPI